MRPLLSVCLVTYNQEQYIRKVLEGAVGQVCDFEYEVVVGEDCSTDGTRAICEEYATRYPERVRLLPAEGHNLGLKENFLRTYSACQGKYIAYLEGDDHWIDNCKLQKQVGILEREPDVVLVHTNCKLWNVASGEVKDRLIEFEGTCIRERQSGVSGVECEFEGHFRHMKTSTCVYRKPVMDSILEEDPQAYRDPRFPTQDFQLFQDMAYRGRFAFIDEDTTVIALAETVSVSSDARKNLAYRIGFHEIGEYYIAKYQVRDEAANAWRRREMHWFLNFGLHHSEVATQVTEWAERQKKDYHPMPLTQHLLLMMLKNKGVRILLEPLYWRNYRKARKG